MTEIVTAQDNINTDSKARIITPTAQPNASIEGGATPYIMPRQTGTGVTRGTQTIAGALAITDPKNNRQIMSISGPDGYQLFKDRDGVNNIIIGNLPDGTQGLVIAKPGVDVLTTFKS